MAIELHVVSGTRTGDRPTYDKSVIAIGRHPSCDLAFDANEELLVSARHAELRDVEGRRTIRDLESRNGTFVNGARIEAETELREGDEIMLGAGGPRLRVRFVSSGRVRDTVPAAPVPRQPTEERVRVAVRQKTRVLRALLPLALVVLVGGVGGAYWMGQRTTRTERAVSRANDAAIAFVATELDGKAYGSTGFGITPGGLLVTNRHTVLTPDGALPTRIAVKFANTSRYLSARVAKVSADDSVDLALIQLEEPGTYPTVSGIAGSTATLEPGAPVVTIGFPHSLDLPMEGDTAKTSLHGGTLSKRLARLLQIDAYAGHGSSGSPIFDARGRVVGVIWGGQAASNGRIVYAVPADRLVELLPSEAQGLVRR